MTTRMHCYAAIDASEVTRCQSRIFLNPFGTVDSPRGLVGITTEIERLDATRIVYVVVIKV